MKQTYAIIGIVVIALFGVVAASYEQYVAKHDFVVIAHADCDPASELCFQHDCKQSAADCDAKPYKKVEKNAKNLRLCGDGVACAPMDCAKGEEGCTVVLCTHDTVEGGEHCADKPIVESMAVVEAQAATTSTATLR